MRTTSKWIVASAAAVGTALLGTSPLAALGKLDGYAAITAAFVGLTIALIGVGWALWAASEALIPPVTTAESLDSPELSDLKDIVTRSRESFFAPFGSSFAEMRSAARHHTGVLTRLRYAAAQEVDQQRKALWDLAIEDARANVELARARQQRVLAFIHAWQVRKAVRRARLHVLAAMILTAAGIVVFLAAPTIGTVVGHGG